jgi:hypothetical protein
MVTEGKRKEKRENNQFQNKKGIENMVTEGDSKAAANRKRAQVSFFILF